MLLSLLSSFFTSVHEEKAGLCGKGMERERFIRCVAMRYGVYTHTHTHRRAEM